ncbi:BTAD domain-containing putative transcriptional regulator [Streptomyces sp. NPDC047061]|uniref:AfsR/SARP family transcriptional regulator n=1 Tax=Streptomyces sp. NPDC047061 TaxID=3154605 RepID=UPI0033F53E6E
MLGPVRAWHGEQELDLGSRQQRVVLAALLLRHPRPITMGELVDAVWGEQPPNAAASVVRTYVSRLRKVLETGRDKGGSPQVLLSANDGYLVRVPRDALDRDVFTERAGEAKRLLAAGEVATAGQLMHAALGLWAGAPLAGLPGPFALTERARLTEERLSALEARLDIDLRLGRHADVIGELTSLSREHPLRERLWHLLMLALYRSGRQADALAVYRGSRRTLVTELGIEPGAPSRDLHNRILAADPSLDLVPPSGRSMPTPPTAPGAGPDEAGSRVAPRGSAAARPAQLPTDLATFAGRSHDLERIRALLPHGGTSPDSVVICAIGGMAGIGKTTLAVHWAHEVAHRFPDGQLYINLRGFDPNGTVVAPQEAIRVFLDAFGVRPERIPAGLDAQAALYRSLLAERRMLILLDNARDTDQIRPLLPGTPGSLVIVTSRNRLNGLVVGEGAHALSLNLMEPDEAHDFLARRIGVQRLTAEPQASDEIIERCSRLPLALAIVAARAATHPQFSLAAIAGELRDSIDSLDAFSGGDITTDIRAVFSWSYDALSGPAARLFHLLGLHTGPDISTPAAAALAGLPAREAHAVLGELTRAHLLTEHLPGRYTLHELLRAFAAEGAHSDLTPRERDHAVHRLLAWYLHTADATGPHLTPHRRRVALEPLPPDCRPLAFTARDQALDWCETERGNLVAAVRHAAAAGHPGIAWRLPAALWGFFYLRGHLHDWHECTSTGLAAARGIHDHAGEVQCLVHGAAALGQMRRTDEAVVHLKQAAAMCRRTGDMYNRAMAATNLGNIYLFTGQLPKAVDYSRRGLALHRIDGNAWGETIAALNLGEAYQQLGRLDEAVDSLEQALAVLRTIDDRWLEGLVLDLRGTVAAGLHRHDDAIQSYHQALTAHQEVGNRWAEGLTLVHLGDAQRTAGDADAARVSWRQALTIQEESDELGADAETIRAKLRELGDRAGSVPSGHPSQP